jgi:predicted metalloendopeptidase
MCLVTADRFPPIQFEVQRGIAAFMILAALGSPLLRANGPLSDPPEFANAFQVPEGAPMRRPAAERVVIR